LSQAQPQTSLSQPRKAQVARKPAVAVHPRLQRLQLRHRLVVAQGAEAQQVVPGEAAQQVAKQRLSCQHPLRASPPMLSNVSQNSPQR